MHSTLIYTRIADAAIAASTPLDQISWPPTYVSQA